MTLLAAVRVRDFGACYLAQGPIGHGSCNSAQRFFDMQFPLGNDNCRGDDGCSCANPKGHKTEYAIGDGECNHPVIFNYRKEDGM